MVVGGLAIAERQDVLAQIDELVSDTKLGVGVAQRLGHDAAEAGRAQ